MSASRPNLTPTMSVTAFRSFYWLKEELLRFCRANGISTTGSKIELADRIAAFLQGEVAPLPIKSSRHSGADMPATFSRDTVIGAKWRCTQPLRQFLAGEIGPGFHFNGVMRDFIATGEGKTLDDAIAAWREDTTNPQQKEIAPQFEYNRHMREYHAANPGASRADARAAWWALRGGHREVGE